MKKKWKKFTTVMVTLTAFFCCLLPLTASAAEEPALEVVSNNRNRQNYIRWASPVTSYLTPAGDGYLRVEYMGDSGGQILLEYYNAALVWESVRSLSCELPYFGGFYAGKNAYFLVFGQSNQHEEDSREVIRVVKYDKNWNRIGAASLYGANTYIPFVAGSLRMAEYGDYLYIRTCHEMYTSEDNLNHQANLTMEVRISDMEMLDSYYEVMNISVGYVSHSFNQFILVDDEANLVALDHGDAYPRCAVLGTYEKAAGNDSFTGRYIWEKVWDFQGKTGDNNTGASIGGLEYSSTHYLTAGNSVVQDENWSTHGVWNIFVTATGKNLREGASTESHWITNYGESSRISASTPQLVKLGSDDFLLLWAQYENGFRNGKISYVFLDGAGNMKDSIYTREGALSDCKPIVMGENVTWYVTDGEKLTFYQVRKDGSFQQKVVQPVIEEQPETPEKPSQPEEPSQPEKPVEPEKPEKPEEPEEPEDLEEPEDPEKPDPSGSGHQGSTQTSQPAKTYKIAVSGKLHLVITGKNGKNNNASVTWRTSNGKYATVNAAGVVKFKKAGIGKTVTVTAISKADGKVITTAKIKILKNAVTGIKVKNAPKTLKAGKSITLKPVVTVSGKNANKKILWSSSNSKYLTVNSNGKVVAKKAGKGKTVYVYGKAADGSGKSVRIKIKIN